MIYPAKKDNWVAAILFITAVIIIGVGIFMMFMIISGAILPDRPILIIFYIMLTLLGVNQLWILFGCSYEITDSDLIVRFGLIRWRLSLERIVEVIPTRKLVGRLGWGYALSLDRLDIRYRKANGKVSFLVLTISPGDKAGFVREVAEKIPDLRVQGMN